VSQQSAISQSAGVWGTACRRLSWLGWRSRSASAYIPECSDLRRERAPGLVGDGDRDSVRRLFPDLITFSYNRTRFSVLIGAITHASNNPTEANANVGPGVLARFWGMISDASLKESAIPTTTQGSDLRARMADTPGDVLVSCDQILPERSKSRTSRILSKCLACGLAST
jgi:hypothetical protein